MQADPRTQLRLLDLQTIDTDIARLRHRRASLPELAGIAEGQKRRSRILEAQVAAKTRVSDLAIDMRKAEGDLDPVRARLERDKVKTSDGSVTDPKQLRALLAEIGHLTTRITDLEDVELAVMEELETAQAELDRVTAERAECETGLRALIVERDAKLALLDADLRERQGERDATAADLPADLLALYDRIAAKSGGVGAALLRGGRCGGCQLEATQADLLRYRQAGPDAVLRCEECQRILVRSAESGL